MPSTHRLERCGSLKCLKKLILAQVLRKGLSAGGSKLEYDLSLYFPLIFNYSRAILEMHRSKGLDDLGSIKWDMALCLFIVYLICYFSLWKGISTSGKVKKNCNLWHFISNYLV